MARRVPEPADAEVTPPKRTYSSIYDEEFKAVFDLAEKHRWEEAEDKASQLYEADPQDPAIQRLLNWVVKQRRIARERAVEDKSREIDSKNSVFNPTLPKLLTEGKDRGLPPRKDIRDLVEQIENTPYIPGSYGKRLIRKGQMFDLEAARGRMANLLEKEVSIHRRQEAGRGKNHHLQHLRPRHRTGSIMPSLAGREKDPKEMSFEELWNGLKGPPKRNGRQPEVLQELMERFSVPLAVLLMGLIGAPLGAQLRAGGRLVGGRALSHGERRYAVRWRHVFQWQTALRDGVGSVGRFDRRRRARLRPGGVGGLANGELRIANVELKRTIRNSVANRVRLGGRAPALFLRKSSERFTTEDTENTETRLGERQTTNSVPYATCAAGNGIAERV